MEEKFDYTETVKALEKIAEVMEDPQTSLDDIDRLLARASELVESCRKYLRSVRQKIEEQEN